jgi:hypothetical protein
VQTEQPRRASGAIVFVSLVAMMVIGIGTVALAVMSATGSGQSGGTQTSTTRALGLELSIVVSPDVGPSGTDFQVTASVTNFLPMANNATGLDEYGGVGSDQACGSAPIAFEVLRGYYTLANYTSGRVVDVHGPGVSACPSQGADLSYYFFQPNSDNFTGPPGADLSSHAAEVRVEVSQAWSGGSAEGTPLPVGRYTAVAADNWGQLAMVHFMVS